MQHVSNRGKDVKPAKRLVALSLAICFASCGQSSKTTSPAAEAVEPALENPGSAVSVSGNDISILNGHGYLRIPDGWRQIRDSEFKLEIEATRYANDGERWAMCHLINFSAPNITLASQDQINRYIEDLWRSTIEEVEAGGQAVAVTYPVLDDNIRAKALNFAAGNADLIMYAIFAIDRAVMHGVHISCDTALPSTDQDRADIAAFARSFRYNP